MSVDPTQPSAPDPTPPTSRRKTPSRPSKGKQPPLPAPTPPTPPTPTPPAGPASGENADSLRQKRRFKRGGDEAGAGDDKPDATIEVLNSLLQDLVAKKDQRTPAAESPASPSKAAKYHRLSKTGSGNPTAPPEITPAPAEATPLVLGSPVPAAVPPSTPPAVTFRPAPTLDADAERRRLRLWKTLFFLSLLALLGLAGYVGWLTRSAGETVTPVGKTAAPPPGAWTDAALQQLDRALAADQAGNLQEARNLAAAITPAKGNLPPGLAFYLANLDTRTERNYDAEADLMRLSKNASPETLAVVEAGLGFNFTRTRDFEKAADAYKNATHNDPFSASLFYHEGEVARHAGHLPDAIASFRRALDRVPTGQPEAASLRDCISLKIRLCLIEQGQEGDFQAERDEQLRSPAPSGHWLLTAAAVALQHKDLAGAASFLGRAREALGQATFDGLLNDYFFRTQVDRKELAEFFPDPATRRAKLLPTRTHTIEP